MKTAPAKLPSESRLKKTERSLHHPDEQKHIWEAAHLNGAPLVVNEARRKMEEALTLLRLKEQEEGSLRKGSNDTPEPMKQWWALLEESGEVSDDTKWFISFHAWCVYQERGDEALLELLPYWLPLDCGFFLR